MTFFRHYFVKSGALCLPVPKYFLYGFVLFVRTGRRINGKRSFCPWSCELSIVNSEHLPMRKCSWQKALEGGLEGAKKNRLWEESRNAPPNRRFFCKKGNIPSIQWRRGAGVEWTGTGNYFTSLLSNFPNGQLKGEMFFWPTYRVHKKNPL